MSLPNIERTIQAIEKPTTVNKKGKNVLKSAPLEHHVASFAFTMVKHAFHGQQWVLTSEKYDINSNKKNPILPLKK